MDDKPRYVRNALDSRQASLRGEPWTEGDWNAPVLRVSYISNAFSFKAFLSHPEEKEKLTPEGKALSSKPVSFRLSPSNAGILFGIMDDALGKTEQFRCVIRNKGYDYKDGERQGDYKVQAQLAFGRDADGNLYMSLRNEDRPIPSFHFKPPHSTEVQMNQEDMSTAQLSDYCYRGWRDAIMRAMGGVVDAHFREDGKG